jgi:hypothetical protein
MPSEDKKQSGDEPKDDPQPKGGEDADAGDAGAAEPSDEVTKWKALSRKHEAQAKANAAAAKRLAELEDAQKSEAERAADKVAQAEKTAHSATSELARLRVAMRKGLTEAQAKRLVGETEEELEADADELLASFGHKDAGGDAGKPTRPKERLRSGAAPDEEPDETDPRKLAATMSRL